jgi:hypothetical protein
MNVMSEVQELLVTGEGRQRWLAPGHKSYEPYTSY